MNGSLQRWLEGLPDWERDGPSQEVPPEPPRPFSPQPTRQCLDALGLLPWSSLVLHVVGSNGKGTASSTAAALLHSHGLRVGLYQSPHLHSRCERIAVDGVAIDEVTYASLLAAIREVCPEGMSRFEVETAAACLHFSQSGVDAVVLEAGLGGVTDATHALPADVVALTSVELEHTAVLGDSLAAIARQKAGVVPQRGLLVSGRLATEAADVVSQIVEARDATWWRAEDMGWRGTRQWRRDGTLIQPEGKARRDAVLLPLRGAHLIHMAEVGSLAARALLARAGRVWSEDALGALRGMTLPGRLQLISSAPPVLLDVAHTPLAMEAALRACRDHMGELPGALLLAIHRDKPFGPVIQALAGAMASVAAPVPLILTTNPGPRGADAQALAAMLRERHEGGAGALPFAVEVVDPVAAAWQRLVQRLGAGGERYGVAMGSFRLAAALLKLLAEPQGGRS